MDKQLNKESETELMQWNCVAQAPTKHSAIMGAILHLELSVHNLEKLADRIQDIKGEYMEMDIFEDQSLSGILLETPNRLNDLSAKIDEAVKKLTECLYELPGRGEFPV